MNRFVIAGLLLVIGVGVMLFMRISKTGIDRLKQHEALRLEPYRDQAGHWTIGYGHKLKPDEWWDRITEQKAEDLLRADLAEAEQAIADLVDVPLTQGQYDALVSFVFNVGVSAFRDSTLLRKLNTGDHAGAAAEFPRWKYVTQGGEKVVSEGLLSRREREQQLFLT